MTDFKVRRPKIAIAGAALGMVCAVLGVVWLGSALRMAILGIEAGYEMSNMQIAIGSWLFLVVGAYCAVIFTGGILILRRRYGLGGILVLIPSILLLTSALHLWYVGIWGIVGGILSLVSKEETPKRVLEIARQKGQAGIWEVANMTGKTEQDIEVAIVKLKSKGQPIRFDMKTRKVIYGSGKGEIGEVP